MSDAPEPLRLFIIILDHPQIIDDLLSGFLEIGVPGGTVIESRGMGQIVRQEMPIFAGLASLFPEHTGSRVLLSVMPESLVEPVYQLVEEVVGHISEPGAAVCFTVPVDSFRNIRH